MLFLKIKSAKDYLHSPELINSTREENNNSVFERLLLWRNTSKMIADHPYIGVGLNNWKIINPTYGIGGTRQTDAGMMSYEHPHNDYLLILAEQGPFGLLIYLMFFFFVIWTGINRLKENDSNKGLIIALICGVIAFSVMSLSSYPRSRVYQVILLMLSASILISFSQGKNQYKINHRIIAFLLLLISVSGIVIFNLRLVSERHAMKVLNAQLKGNFNRQFTEAGKADSWLCPMDITSTPFSWYRGMAKFYMQNIPEAINEYEKAVLVHPNHLRVLNDLATSYETSGRREEAISLYRRALKISPMFVEGNLNISATYYNSEKFDSAYYFINQINDLKMSWKEENNYKKFKIAIESAVQSKLK